MKYKYKVLWIVGTDTNYRRRVFVVSKSEFNFLNKIDTFVLRETIDGQKIYRSCETDRHYMIEKT